MTHDRERQSAGATHELDGERLDPAGVGVQVPGEGVNLYWLGMGDVGAGPVAQGQAADGAGVPGGQGLGHDHEPRGGRRVGAVDGGDVLGGVHSQEGHGGRNPVQGRGLGAVGGLQGVSGGLVEVGGVAVLVDAACPVG